MSKDERMCFECGRPSECDHHVVPRSRGGTRTVPLCGECHGKAHHTNKNMNTSTLTKAALAAAKKRGVRLGSSRPGHWEGNEHKRLAGSRRGVKRAAELRTREATVNNAPAVAVALELRRAGASWQEVAEALNDRGFVTRRGGAWGKSGIYSAVKSTAGEGE